MQFAQGKNILKKNGKNEFLEPPISTILKKISTNQQKLFFIIF